MSEDYLVINQGQTIEINYKALGKVFKLDIVETQPAEIISIIDADLNVDFEEPLDYVAPPTVKRSPSGAVRPDKFTAEGGRAEGGRAEGVMDDQKKKFASFPFCTILGERPSLYRRPKR